MNCIADSNSEFLGYAAEYDTHETAPGSVGPKQPLSISPQGMKELLLGLGVVKRSLDENRRIVLPRSWCQRLFEMLDEPWIIFAWNRGTVRLLPQSLWTSFEKRESKNFVPLASGITFDAFVCRAAKTVRFERAGPTRRLCVPKELLLNTMFDTERCLTLSVGGFWIELVDFEVDLRMHAYLASTIHLQH